MVYAYLKCPLVLASFASYLEFGLALLKKIYKA